MKLFKWHKASKEKPKPHPEIPYIDVLVWYRRGNSYKPTVATWSAERQEYLGLETVVYWSYIEIPNTHKYNPLYG